MANYDPLVANGILAHPVSSLLEGAMMDPLDAPYRLPGIKTNPNEAPKDTFEPSQPKKTGFGWKKWAFGALVATLTFFGLKKFGINPFKKFNLGDKFQTVKNYVANKFSGLNIKENLQKGIKKITSFFGKKTPPASI